MEINISYDTSFLKKEMQEKMIAAARNTAASQIERFFNKRNIYITDKLTIVKGDGYKEIEDLIANKFLEPGFQESMSKYFDYNWQRIFEECMTKAIQHKANAIVFAKTKELPSD